jgi:hypothetical protein
MIQEMKLLAENTFNELVKVMIENVALEMEYNKVKKGRDKAT